MIEASYFVAEAAQESGGSEAARLKDRLEKRSMSYKSKADKGANNDHGNCELDVPYQSVAPSIHSDLRVVQAFVIALT
jgi:hypothetical protein